MAHSLKDLDAWICGDNDPNAPFNQIDSEIDERNLMAMFEDEDENAFRMLISKVAREVNALRDYAKSNENIYLLKRLNSIYNKL